MTEPMEYKLFWYPGSCARMSFVALEEIGAPWELNVVDRIADEPSYRDVNPKGKVPALVAEGRTFTENPALLTFLARRHPEARLLPAPESSAGQEALELMSWFAAGVHPAITRQRIPQLFCDDPGSFESISARARALLEESFGLIERRLGNGPWILGEEWTIVDVYVLWLWFRATGSGMDGAPYPNCIDHAGRCQERPSVATALDREELEFRRLREDGKIPDSIPDFQAGRAPIF
ncbi:MAG: glutathione S-transferase family protein [Solirubrobacterales bacterium]